MKFCRLGTVRCIYLAVGGAIIVRIGGDLYTCDGRGCGYAWRIDSGEDTSEAPIILKNGGGALWHIVSL